MWDSFVQTIGCLTIRAAVFWRGCIAVRRRNGGGLFLLRQERRSQPVEIAHRIVRARMPAFEKFVEHPPLAEQPMALHALELVLVDAEGSHLERAVGSVVRHLDP